MWKRRKEHLVNRDISMLEQEFKEKHFFMKFYINFPLFSSLLSFPISHVFLFSPILIDIYREATPLSH